MTAPALFQQELAKRGIKWQKATGCPRKKVEHRRIEVAKTVRKIGRPRGHMSATLARWQEWRRLYEEERLSTPEIAARYGVKHQAVGGALRKLGVAFRAPGWAEKVAKLKRENAALRGRCLHYRLQLRKYQQEAA